MVRPDKGAIFRVIRAVMAESSETIGKSAAEKVLDHRSKMMDPVHSCTNLLIYFVNIKEFSGVISTYGHFVSGGLAPNFKMLDLLIRSFSRLNCVEQAFGAMGKMLKMGFVPDVVNYTNIIEGLITQGRVEDATGLLVQMEKVGCPPDSVTYRCVITGLLKQGKGALAIDLYKDMEMKGIVPDPDLYHTVIKGYKTGEIEAPVELTAKMLVRKPEPR